jgi:hypothetical protein
MAPDRSASDSLMTLRPDGKLYVQSGVGKSRHAFGDGSRARRRPKCSPMPWEKVEVAWGDTGKGVPWSCSPVGSQTTARDDAARTSPGANDLKRKLQELAGEGSRRFAG